MIVSLPLPDLTKSPNSLQLKVSPSASVSSANVPPVNPSSFPFGASASLKEVHSLVNVAMTPA